jgi:hypothetical protein
MCIFMLPYVYCLCCLMCIVYVALCVLFMLPYVYGYMCIMCMVICELIQRIKKTRGWDSPNMLRIITFYQGQVILLNRILAQKGYGNVLVATVDSSQGCEANLVIISFVRSSTTKKGVRAAAGFLADDRRINVALTRARHQLICVGDANGSLGREGSSTLKNLVSDAKQRRSIIDNVESKLSNRWNC